jgi:hypothetical protein
VRPSNGGEGRLDRAGERWKTLVKSIVYPVFNRRRFQAYCVSLPKSGTKSMAGIFKKHYRAAHEKEHELVIGAILASADGSMGDAELRRLIKERDRRLWLELDSSTLNYFLLDVFLREFPGARFMLTIRDPHSWLDSIINHKMGRGLAGIWTDFTRYSFRPQDFTHARAESALAERGLFTLDCYFSCWARHIETVLERVPEHRLLVVRTDEIDSSLSAFADFLSIPSETLDPSKAHLHRAVGRFGVLSEIDPVFLREKCLAHCESLLKRYFPELLADDWRGPEEPSR